MAYADTERSIASAAPIELFKFTGTFNTYRYTSHVKNVTNTDGTYIAKVMRRNKTESANQEEDNLALELELPHDDPMVTEYVFQTSPPSLLCQFYRCHADNYNDTILMWSGQVLSWSISGRVAKLKVPNAFAYVFDKPVPPVKYQSPCNHVLGDFMCKVDMTSGANSQDTTISSIDGTDVVVAASTFTENDCAGGEMIVGAERRMIISNTGTTFVIASPFASAVATDPVTIRRGCDHTFTGDCKTKFNNGQNFGGFPLVPNRNPFSSRL